MCFNFIKLKIKKKISVRVERISMEKKSNALEKMNVHHYHNFLF